MSHLNLSHDNPTGFVCLIKPHTQLAPAHQPPTHTRSTMSSEAMSKRRLIATIAEEDTVTGLLLAGTGEVKNGELNFLTVIPGKTTLDQIEDAFDKFTTERDDIAILLINQHLADQIRYKVDSFSNAFPAILEIPSKDHPYDPEKDSILKKVRRLFGE